MAEILPDPDRRRRWTSEQKLALVSESLRPGASPTQVARRYGISTGLLYTWRQLARRGEWALVPMAPPAPAFVPVEIVPEASGLCGGERGDGVMVIELAGDSPPSRCKRCICGSYSAAGRSVATMPEPEVTTSNQQSCQLVKQRLRVRQIERLE